MNNPISQIERTKDAYAGNIQGLQKRANVSKELIDLLAMQQLKKDLDAAKRNQMMQMQGNPATVKDQLQQGLMGEYRQQAAKEMGMMPSEGQAIARAQQAMPQGMPQQQARMPQGMPQGAPQQPQMAQGMMSQARPVQLAGGGIVAFNEGMRVTAPEEDGLFGLFSLPDMDAVRRAEERRKAERARAIAAGGDYPENITVEEAVEAVNEALADPNVKARRAEEKAAEAAKAKADEEFELPSEDLAMLDEVMRPAAKKPAPAETQPAGLAAVVQTPEKTGGEDEELGIRELLMQKLRRDIDRDPEAAGAARAAMIRKELGLDEGLAALDERKTRRKQLLEDMKVTGMDRFQELLTAASIGGARGVGIRGSQLRQAERNRRMAYENKLDEIENTAMELRRNIGTTAAEQYGRTATDVTNTINNAATVLQRMDAEDAAAERAEIAQAQKTASYELQQMGTLLTALGDPNTASARMAAISKEMTGLKEAAIDRLGLTNEFMVLRSQERKGGNEAAAAAQRIKELEAEVQSELMKDSRFHSLKMRLDALGEQAKAAEGQRAQVAEMLAAKMGLGSTAPKSEEIPNSTDFETYRNK